MHAGNILSDQQTFKQYQAATGGRAFEITLKAPCTIIDPEIKIATDSNPTGYNYCNIPIFGRYYWIKNWTYSDARWIASLTVDTLASYRAQISNATEYVVRSSAKYDGNIVDSLYPTKAPITTKTVKASSTPFSDDPEGNVGFSSSRSTLRDMCLLAVPFILQ